jgi:peroxiredoxin
VHSWGPVVRLAALIFAVAGAVVVLALVLPGSRSEGRFAPQLPTRVLSGSSVTLASLRGKPTLVNFFASWCASCIREAHDVQRAYQKLGERANLVSVAWDDRRTETLRFVERYRWTMPVLEDSSGLVGNAYGISGLPVTFVLDANGRVVKRLSGPQTLAGLLATVPS